MRGIAEVVGLALLVAACASGGSPPPSRPIPPPVETRTQFRCDNGETVLVRFFPQQGIAVLERGGQNVELQQQRTGSGFLYSNGQTSIRGQGNDMTMTVGNMAPTQCRAVGGGQPVPPPGGGGDPVLEGTFFYRCENGDRIEVRFFPNQGVATLQRGGRSHEMTQQPTSRGFIFKGADYQIQGRDQNLQLIPTNEAPIACVKER